LVSATPGVRVAGPLGDESAPVCRTCADATEALNACSTRNTPARRPDAPRRTARLSDDTASSTGLGGRRAQVRGRVRRLGLRRRGPSGALFEPSTGHGCPAEGPLTVLRPDRHRRQGRRPCAAIQSTVGRGRGKLRAYFEDIEIVRRFENSPSGRLSWLVRSLAAQGESRSRPDLAPALPGDPRRVALPGGRPRQGGQPDRAGAETQPGAAQALAERSHSSAPRSTVNSRAKANTDQVLIPKEVSVMLDPVARATPTAWAGSSPCSRSLQGTPSATRASIVDRFYAPHRPPGRRLRPLLRKAQHHQAKLDGAYYRGSSRRSSTCSAEAFLHAELEEQGLFALATTQKADLWRAGPSLKASGRTPSERRNRHLTSASNHGVPDMSANRRPSPSRTDTSSCFSSTSPTATPTATRRRQRPADRPETGRGWSPTLPEAQGRNFVQLTQAEGGVGHQAQGRLRDLRQGARHSRLSSSGGPMTPRARRARSTKSAATSRRRGPGCARLLRRPHLRRRHEHGKAATRTPSPSREG